MLGNLMRLLGLHGTEDREALDTLCDFTLILVPKEALESTDQSGKDSEEPTSTLGDGPGQDGCPPPLGLHVHSNHEQAAQAPGAVSVLTSRYNVALHSAVLRPILAACKEQTSMVIPCDSLEEVEAGKLVVGMMTAHPTECRAMAQSLASLPVSTIIRCLHFAVYLDAPKPLELSLSGLCMTQPDSLHARDINALLARALPSAISIIPKYRDQVKSLCSRWLQHAFGNTARMFGSEQLKAELCSLELPAIQLFESCMSPNLSREEVVHALVLWCSYPARSASLGDEVFGLFNIKDPGTMMSLPPESRARDVCIKYLLHFYKDVQEVVVQQRLRSIFFGLPFAAVCLWAEQDGLMVRHSENEVAVLLELYADAARLPAPQRKQLGSLVHVSNMSYSFRHFILSKLSLVSAFSDALTAFNVALDVGGPEGLSACAVESPSAWVGIRQVCSATPFAFECSFPVAKLASMLAGAVTNRGVLSDPFFYAGFYWRIVIEFSTSASMGIFMMPSRSFPIPLPSFVQANFDISLGKADGGFKEVGGFSKWLKDGKSWGRAVPDVSSMEQLKAYIDHGKLWVRCNINKIV